MSRARCFQAPPPGLDLSHLNGMLVVIEGPDSSGRSTHVGLLTKWLEEQGYAVEVVGLRRSMLVAPELEKAKEGNVLSPRTMSLFYATDFYDQMENIVVPALHSGSIVLADRYIFTLMTRDLVRGADREWIESLYSRALVPDAVFFLQIPPSKLPVRALMSHGRLDYWESGLDMALSHEWFDCFLKYQKRIDVEFRDMIKRYGFIPIRADRPLKSIQKDLRHQMEDILKTMKSS